MQKFKIRLLIEADGTAEEDPEVLKSVEAIDESEALQAERDGLAKAAKERLRKLALDPIKRRKTFKIVPGAALSREAARLAQFYEQAWSEQRAAFDTEERRHGTGQSHQRQHC